MSHEGDIEKAVDEVEKEMGIKFRRLRFAWESRAHYHGIAYLRFLWWTLVRRYSYELCQSCGRPVGLVWSAPDLTWQKIVRSPHGLRCIPCFNREHYETTGEPLRWVPRGLDDPFDASVFASSDLDRAHAEMEQLKKERDEALEDEAETTQTVLSLAEKSARYLYERDVEKAAREAAESRLPDPSALPPEGK